MGCSLTLLVGKQKWVAGDKKDPNQVPTSKRMNSVSRFFFWVYISISDAVEKGYGYIGELLSQIANHCSRKGTAIEDNVEVLNVKEMASRRIFVNESL